MGANMVNSYRSEDETATHWKGWEAMRDAALVAAARAGDSSAFVELGQRHSKRILLKIYRMTNNWQDAEDVLQESWMKAFIHLETFECRASFSTWFTSIAINTALMLLRKERRFVRSEIDITSEDGAQSDKCELRDHRDNPEQHYARIQGARLLRSALQQLRPGSRRVVELQQNGQLSTRQIAKHLGISESAVKSRLLRARSLLRKLVKDEPRRCHALS
jgi:RNA polymerase sigma-70 factor (ECF subfamily)